MGGAVISEDEFRELAFEVARALVERTQPRKVSFTFAIVTNEEEGDLGYAAGGGTLPAHIAVPMIAKLARDRGYKCICPHCVSQAQAEDLH